MAHNVLLYESNRIMLGTLSNVIKSAPNCNLVASYQSHTDALGQGKVFNPNLLLIDVESQDATWLITEFRKAFPSAIIICMGERWQADSASHLVQAGASGYIIKPFSAVELKDTIDTFAKGGGLETSCKVMTFFSPKGKCGKTTLIANLAMSLARKTNEPVGIIDADLQFGDMAVFFNLNPSNTIVEAARDADFLAPVSLQSLFVPVTDNVSVLCGTRNPSLIDRVAIKDFETVVNSARSLFKYLLIDVPAGFNPTSISAAEIADVTYLVAMNNDGFEKQHIRKAISLFEEDWPDVKDRLKVVFTRVEPYGAEKSSELENQLGFPMEGILPNEYMLVSKAADNGRMALDIASDSRLSDAISHLADKIIRHQVRRDTL